MGGQRLRRGAGTALMAVLLLAGMAGSRAAAQSGGEWLLADIIDDPLPDWNISGSNTLHYEYYGDRGDAAASPYPFVGTQIFNDFDVSAFRRVSPYQTWRGFISGVVNNSEYRSDDQGLDFERLNLAHQNGETFVPYRAELGDYFAFFSLRTLQLPLKGAMVEFQPEIGSRAWTHSIQFLTGANQATWHDFEPLDDYSSGASWAVDDPLLGTVSANFVHNRKIEQPESDQALRNQGVWSVALDKRLEVWDQRLALEGEFAQFRGDHDSVIGGEDGRDVAENGSYAQLSGHSDGPLNYRLRFDHYGKDFQPNGAQVPADRRSYEAHAGWRFDDGLQVRGRAQVFADGLESTTVIDTTTYGMNITGPVLPELLGGLTVASDTFMQESETIDDTLDNRTYSTSNDITLPLFDETTGRLGVSYQLLDDLTPINADSRILQIRPSIIQGLRIFGLQGSIAPGLLGRSVRSTDADSEDYGGSIGIFLSGGPHDISFNYDIVMQDRRDDDRDLLEHNLSFNYRYSIGRHTLAVDGNYYKRNPLPGRNTKAFRAGISWTVQFDKPAQQVSRATDGAAAAAQPTPGQFGLASLPPGIALADAQGQIEAAGITGGIEQGGFVVYNTRFLEEIDQRQRLVLARGNGTVQKAAVIIDFDDVGRPDDSRQTFERVRKALIDRYGSPARTFEEGEFSAALVDDVNSGKFLRIAEWNTSGGVLRLGIPRRLDGLVRIEIQHADGFPPRRQNLWSVEAVR